MGRHTLPDFVSRGSRASTKWGAAPTRAASRSSRAFWEKLFVAVARGIFVAAERASAVSSRLREEYWLCRVGIGDLDLSGRR